MTGVAAYAVVENSLVRLTQAGAGHTGIRSSSTRTAFDQVTVVGPGDVDSFGLEASPQGGIGVPGSTPDGTATLDGLVIRGFGHALAAEPGSYECGTDNFQPIYCSDSSTISVSHSDFDPSRDVTDPTYGHITIGAGNLNVDPAFRNPAAGDYSLLRKSPVVDKGDPSAPLSGDATTDLAGAQRKVDGDGDGKAIVDMGTFELPTPRFGANALVKLDRGAKKIPASGPLPVVVSNLNGFLVRGTLSGETANKIPVGHHEKRRVGLGSKPFSVAGHRGVTVLLDLPKKVVKYFKHRGELTVDLLARVRDPAGDFRTIPKTISVALK